MSDNAICGAWFAWANMDAPACDKIWFFVSWAVSLAMSTSTTREFAAERLVAYVPKLEMVTDNLFCIAPMVPRREDTAEIAASSAEMDESALAEVETPLSFTANAVVVAVAMVSVRRSSAEFPEPT